MRLPPGRWFDLSPSRVAEEIPRGTLKIVAEPAKKLEVLIASDRLPRVGLEDVQALHGHLSYAIAETGARVTASQALPSTSDHAFLFEVTVPRPGRDMRGFVAVHTLGDRAYTVVAIGQERLFDRVRDDLRLVVDSFALRERPLPKLASAALEKIQPFFVKEGRGWGTAFPIGRRAGGDDAAGGDRCLLLTAAHVVQDQQQLWVTDHEGKQS